ncbi:MAG: hypothetical protein V1844_15340 [Pseudomonadota bacterium]
MVDQKIIDTAEQKRLNDVREEGIPWTQKYLYWCKFIGDVLLRGGGFIDDKRTTNQP